MKKILILLFALFLTSNLCFAQDNKTPINFIYIHGSDQGTYEEFKVWTNKMHPEMKKHFEKSQFISEHLLANSCIKPEEDILYWANRTKTERNTLDNKLKISELVSRFLAQMTRTTMAHLLHDAIWLQVYDNMAPIQKELNDKVIANAKKGEKTVLVGYSAGTFITYQYLLHVMKTIDLISLLQNHQQTIQLTQTDINNLKKINSKPTCVAAIIESNLAVLDASGKLVPIGDKEQVVNNFKNLESNTELYCSPDNAIVGVINFGSPISIFYSSDNKNPQILYLRHSLLAHIIENNQFLLTVNYKKDPFGVPIANTTISATNEYAPNLKRNGGFFYDTYVDGGRNFAASHLRYWDEAKHFTKEIAESYEKGYNYFYEIK